MLTRLVLSHFRSHRRTDLMVGPGMIALYGPNGAGKTNLLEAISLFSPGRGLRGAAAEAMARRPEAIGWKLRAHVAGHEIATWSEGAGRRVAIDGKLAPQAALGGVLRILWLTPAMDRLWTDPPAERRRYLDRIALSLDPGHGTTVLDYEKALRERNRLLRDGVAEARWLSALEAQMATAGAAVTRARLAAIERLSLALAEGFPAPRLALIEAEGRPEPEADRLAAQLRAGRARDLAAGRSLSGPHRADLEVALAAKAMPAAQASTGEQKALLIAILLANARAVAADFGRPPVLLLDEVAAHLDPARRAALYAQLQGLGAQAFLTGTADGLFADLGAAMRLRVSEGPDGSRVVPAGYPTPE